MLIIRDEVNEDIDRAYRWYEQRQPGLGEGMVSEVDQLFYAIEASPQMYVSVYKSARRAICHRFPYSVYYLEQQGDVVVLAVLHQRQSSELWQNRIDHELQRR